MASHIYDLFGYPVSDKSRTAQIAREDAHCPFLGNKCTKVLRDGTISGVCSIKPATTSPVICCPVRLYANDYQILREVADSVFGAGLEMEPGPAAVEEVHRSNVPVVAVFGKGWGGELRLPQRSGRGAYFVDWILALIRPGGVLTDFVAIEVQTIDTIGNYRNEREALLRGETPPSSTAGLNWENVNKRILPQLIYKGHVLRREPLCTKGLFFICPESVYKRIGERLGGELLQYAPQPGSLTFRWYNYAEPGPTGTPRGLACGGQLTTTIDQVAVAFTSPQNLPPPGVYEQAIKAGLAGR